MAKRNPGIFEKRVIAEKLARKFYALQGCNAPDDKPYYMEESTHPQEQFCYQAALLAIKELLG